jgi:hypothetical protein
LLKRQRLGDDGIGSAHALKVEALAGPGELLKQTAKIEPPTCQQ